MAENEVIKIPNMPGLVAILLDDHADDWFEVLKFLAKIADEQGVYFDKSAIAKALVSKYAPSAMMEEFA